MEEFNKCTEFIRGAVLEFLSNMDYFHKIIVSAKKNKVEYDE